MTTCPHTLIEPALDRWAEAHWHLHQMEGNYHTPEPFRYALNSFIRVIKEVPDSLAKCVQNNPSMVTWQKGRLPQLRATELFSLLSQKRDFIVHHGAMKVLSQGRAGTVEGRKVKISFPFAVHPEESSDDAYTRYKQVCRTDKMIRSLIGPDCDSSPAIWRTWMIQELPGRDLLDVAFDAWKLVGEVLSEAVIEMGGEPLDLTMPCRHDTELVQVRRFSQAEFFLEVDGIDLEEEERNWRAERAGE